MLKSLCEESERDLEQRIRTAAEKMGFVCRKIQYPNRAGCPDRFFLKNGRLIFMELKRPGCKPKGKQLEELDLLKRHYREVYVVDSFDSAMDILTGKLNETESQGELGI